MPEGRNVIPLAESRIGEKYVNQFVPKNDANWHGPWDCAEFASWLVFQAYGVLYGTEARQTNPAKAEAYTGFWADDARNRGQIISYSVAARIPGAFILKVPPGPGKMGHIVVSDGKGGTIEAMGSKYGVCRGRVEGRAWNFGILIPGVNYDSTSVPAPSPSPGPGPTPPPNPPLPEPPVLVLARNRPPVANDRVRELQRQLNATGFDPGPIDGEFGPRTESAVIAFQKVKNLTIDGEVGPQTGRALGLTFWAPGEQLPPSMQPPEELPTDPPATSEPTETRPVNPTLDLSKLRDEYVAMWRTMAIRDNKLASVDKMVDRIADSKSRYQAVADQFPDLPWWMIAAVHAMESGANFKTHLHNGDPLKAQTVHVPAGRPPIWDPSWPWEKSAEDAVVYDGLNRWNDWKLPGALYKLESYNGFGPRRKFGRASAYLWSFSNHYVAGKYVADGVWDPDAVSDQIGAAVLLRRMVARRLMPQPELA
jgi:lysozyme family protein